MIRVRTKQRPHEFQEYASRKEILDLVRWGWVLEVQEVDEDEEKSHDASTELFQVHGPAQNHSGESKVVLTEEQLEEVTPLVEEKPKRNSRSKYKASSDDKSKDEQG